MTAHVKKDLALQERAEQYVCGLMEEREAAEYARHLAEGCTVCREEVRVFEDIASDLALLGAPADPPTRLRERLIAAIGAEAANDLQTWKRWRPETGERRLQRAGEGEWEKTDIAGIEVKKLGVDARTESVTMLIRMAPGTRYPRHRHAGREECYVLEGDLRHRDQVMRSGDFEVVEARSIHDDQWTEGGCLLLVHSSQHDELLPG